MKNNITPNPKVIHPVKGFDSVTYVMPGVRIDDGAIIGANSVVASDVEPYTIVIGNPAKPVRKRFDDGLIELMLKFKWWDKSALEINELIPILTSDELEVVKREIEKRM